MQASIEGISFTTASAINGRMTCDMLISTTDSLLPALFDNVASMEAWLALDKEGIDSGLILKVLYESAAACLRELISLRGSFGSVFENGKHYPVACEINFGQVIQKSCLRVYFSEFVPPLTADFCLTCAVCCPRSEDGGRVQALVPVADSGSHCGGGLGPSDCTRRLCEVCECGWQYHRG